MLILKPSKIHGVGVFTTVPIRKGVKLLLFARGDWHWVNKLTGYQRRYGTPAKDGGYYLPKDFNRMSSGYIYTLKKRGLVQDRNQPINPD